MKTDPQPELIGTKPFMDDNRCVACGRFLPEDDLGQFCRKCEEEDRENEYYDECFGR